MMKARFRIEISGECDMKNNENTALDTKQRIEATFVPYLWDNEFGVDGVSVSVNTYEDGLNKPMKQPDGSRVPGLGIDAGEA